MRKVRHVLMRVAIRKSKHLEGRWYIARLTQSEVIELSRYAHFSPNAIMYARINLRRGRSWQETYSFEVNNGALHLFEENSKYKQESLSQRDKRRLELHKRKVSGVA